jgi:hypothetical protein
VCWVTNRINGLISTFIAGAKLDDDYTTVPCLYVIVGYRGQMDIPAQVNRYIAKLLKITITDSGI